MCAYLRDARWLAENRFHDNWIVDAALVKKTEIALLIIVQGSTEEIAIKSWTWKFFEQQSKQDSHWIQSILFKTGTIVVKTVSWLWQHFNVRNARSLIVILPSRLFNPCSMTQGRWDAIVNHERLYITWLKNPCRLKSISHELWVFAPIHAKVQTVLVFKPTTSPFWAHV